MVMDCKYIEQLLERYWQCETSLEDAFLVMSSYIKGLFHGLGTLLTGMKVTGREFKKLPERFKAAFPFIRWRI